MATLFSGKVFTFTQPDGTPIQVRGWGDQYHAVFETLDGFTLTQNPATGWYEVAQLSDDGRALQPAPGAAGPLDTRGATRGLRVSRAAAQAEARESALHSAGRRCDQRREERRSQLRALRSAAAAGGPLLAPPQRQTVGDYVGLCLLIDFSDAPATIARDEVERFCNLPGYNGFGNRGSVADFFLDNSIGRCRYTNVVAPYYRARHAKTHYTDPNVAQPQRAVELINEALAHHRAAGFDFSVLTADNQGFVYAMNVYYAGLVTNNWREGLWPHAHHLGSAVTLAPGRKAFDYQVTAMGAELTLGTFCHENGHMLCDYPDLYDYGDQSSGIGGYCLMCAGNNVDEKNPVPIGAYLKRLSGWARSVTPLAHGQQVTLEAGSNDFALHTRGGREYFILENRRRAGRDAALPDEGLAIWHVDEEGNNNHEQMTGATHYECSLEQADGLFHLERQSNHLGDNGDLFSGPAARFADDTLPDSKWWNGTTSALAIDQISAPGTAISFRALLGDVAVPPPDALVHASAPGRAIPDNQPAGITDSIAVAEALTLSALTVGLEISHAYLGDLRVSLATPWGSEVELYRKGQGGNAKALKVTLDESTLPALSTLRGRSIQGAWTLAVQDLAPADVGVLDRWTLTFTGSVAADTAPIALKESPGLPIPDFPQAGIERTLLAAGAAQVGSVEVSVDIAHTWIGDLRLSLRSPQGTEVRLQEASGSSEQGLVRTFTTANTPALSPLAGEPVAGPWRLMVLDTAARDAGKLNHWRLLIQPRTP